MANSKQCNTWFLAKYQVLYPSAEMTANAVTLERRAENEERCLSESSLFP